VLVRRRIAVRFADQLTLFHPPVTALQWTDLPEDVRHRTMLLLANLLCAHRGAPQVEQLDPEVRDE
jgi:hypothetical protein